jgi:hypothetical protein
VLKALLNLALTAALCAAFRRRRDKGRHPCPALPGGVRHACGVEQFIEAAFDGPDES